MGQEGRGDEAQWKHEKQQGQCRPVLERGEAKKIQYGRVDKVMAEEKDRNGDKDEEWNKNETSRDQGSRRAKRALFILHTRAGNAKNAGLHQGWEHRGARAGDSLSAARRALRCPPPRVIPGFPLTRAQCAVTMAENWDTHRHHSFRLRFP